ncbi:hypothetical protein [Alistipes sp. An66]|uniref:hypothetical protein n=1 Tax=Alistipes sp. An66 TaxID=1965650 RepID=UPI000B365F4F|nr:hypothetical protein [Alistipes sp. An66]
MNHEQIVPISKGGGNRVGLLLLPSLLHLFLLTPPAQAQTAAISGHVFDAADRRSLPGAHLHLLQAADSSLLVSTMADMDGNFALKLPDTTAPLLLKATYLGYADRYTAIEGDTPLEIEMQARDYAIGGVVVKAPLFQRKSDRFVFNVSAARGWPGRMPRHSCNTHRWSSPRETTNSTLSARAGRRSGSTAKTRT